MKTLPTRYTLTQHQLSGIKRIQQIFQLPPKDRVEYDDVFAKRVAEYIQQFEISYVVSKTQMPQLFVESLIKRYGLSKPKDDELETKKKLKRRRRKKLGDKRKCKFCGKPFSLVYTHHKYCSKDCYYETNRIAFNNSTKLLYQTFVCPDCGKTTIRLAPNQRRCTECRESSDLKHKRIKMSNYKRYRKLGRREIGGEYKCVQCDKQFVLIYPNQTFCSSKCKYQSKKKRRLL